MRPMGILVRAGVLAGLVALSYSLMRTVEQPAAPDPTPPSAQTEDSTIPSDDTRSPSGSSAPQSELVGSRPVVWQTTTRWCGPADATHWVTVKVTASAARARSLERFAEITHATLCNQKSWIKSGKVRWRFKPDGKLHVGLWTANETEERCMDLIGLSVGRKYSCADSGKREVVINGRPWDNTTDGWPSDAGRLMYRRMLVNHEVGHAIRERHRDCTGNGLKAPVMMQQSKGMNLNGYTCKPNPWPLARELRALSPPSIYRR